MMHMDSRAWSRLASYGAENTDGKPRLARHEKTGEGAFGPHLPPIALLPRTPPRLAFGEAPRPLSTGQSFKHVEPAAGAIPSTGQSAYLT